MMRDARALPHPPNKSIKMPALFEGKDLVDAGHVGDCLETCGCFLCIYIPCYTSVLDGFLDKGSALSLDRCRLKV